MLKSQIYRYQFRTPRRSTFFLIKNARLLCSERLNRSRRAASMRAQQRARMRARSFRANRRHVRCTSGVQRAKIVPEDLPTARKTEKRYFLALRQSALVARLEFALGRDAATYRATIRRNDACSDLFSSWNSQGHREIIMQITVMLAGIPPAWRIYRSVPLANIYLFTSFSVCLSFLHRSLIFNFFDFWSPPPFDKRTIVLGNNFAVGEFRFLFFSNSTRQIVEGTGSRN